MHRGEETGTACAGTYFRDATMDLDYADQQYYVAGMERLSAVDPSAGNASDTPDPRSFELYLYTEIIYFYAGRRRIATYAVQYQGPDNNGNMSIVFAQSTYNVYFGGKLIVAGGQGVVLDRLGSVVARRSNAYPFNYETHAYFPYGEERTTTANNRDKFATYFRDASTGLDYADQRFYSSINARFLSADPYQASGGANDPRSWNHYAYVGNDPVNRTDPSGLQEGTSFCDVYPNHPQCANFLRCPDGTLILQGGTCPDGDPGTPVANKYEAAQRNAMMGLWTISEGGFKQKADCRNIFSALISQNDLGLSVDTLMDQVSQAALKAYRGATVYDGPSSSVPLDPDKFPGAASSGATTVGQWFAQGSGREALSQYNGTTIFLYLENWSGISSPYTSGGGASQYGLGTLFHEVLHKNIVGGGFTHEQIDAALKAAGAQSQTLYRNFDSDNLGRKCF